MNHRRPSASAAGGSPKPKSPRKAADKGRERAGKENQPTTAVRRGLVSPPGSSRAVCVKFSGGSCLGFGQSSVRRRSVPNSAGGRV